MLSAATIIQQYQLQPHPEGGWYKETYRSSQIVAGAALPESFGGDRSISTAIYFLLEKGNFSAFHRIKSDECWHFYSGDPLVIYIIQQDGLLSEVVLGSDILKGQLFQYVVPANCWFASRPAVKSSFCFTGCTVAPGFDFADFEMAEANKLALSFPQYADLISGLCR